jgi:hypothetical protein
MTDYTKKYLKETIKAINKLIQKGQKFVDTRTIRRINKISSSDRSRINFIWRSLETLEEDGYLEVDGRSHPKLYVIKSEEEIEYKED